MSQRGFQDEQERVAKLHDKKPVLMVLAEMIHWDTLIPRLDQTYQGKRKTQLNANVFIRLFCLRC